MEWSVLEVIGHNLVNDGILNEWTSDGYSAQEDEWRADIQQKAVGRWVESNQGHHQRAQLVRYHQMKLVGSKFVCWHQMLQIQ